MHKCRLPSVRVVVLFAAVAAPANLRAAEPTAYFPDGTTLVASFNVRQILDAPLVRENASARSAAAEMTKALDGMGIQSGELDRVVLAVGEQLRAATSLVLMHGRFDADRIQNRLKERARERKNEIDVVNDGGVTIYECRLPRPSTPNPRVVLPDRYVLTVLDANTIAMALDRAALSEAIAKKAGRRKSEVKPRVGELVGRIDPKQSLSVVFVPGAETVAGGPVSGLVDVTGGVVVADAVTTQVRLTAKDPETTRSLADGIRDALAKARDILPGLAAIQFGLDRPGQDAVRDMLDSFKVTSRENAVTVAGTITKEMIDRAVRK